MILDQGVPGELNAARDDDAVPEVAVVGDVAARHEQGTVADAGHAAPLHRAPVDGDELAHGVAVPEDDLCGLAAVGEVLRGATDAGLSDDHVLLADLRHAVEDDLGADARPVADADVRTDHGVGTDGDVDAELGAGFDDRCGVDQDGHREPLRRRSW